MQVLNPSTPSSAIDRFISFFVSLRWHHWAQIIISIHIISFPAWAPSLGFDVSGIGDAFIRGLYTRFPLIIPIIFPIRWWLGKNDYRFKIVLHMLVLVIIMVLELYISNNTELSAMQAFGFLSFPIVILVVVTIFSILAINKPFIQEFREVSDRIIAGDVSTKIEAEEILDDSVFGPIGHLLNSIMGNIETNVVQISETNTLIRATSDLLATNTEEINASAEEVASTSQSMSHGASSQTDMIAAVSDEIKNTTRIVDEIVSSIRSNTNQVAQIALQTNILALNAGIEASRAGDYGRGFAVVAENIRKLSDQSKIASENISEVADEIAARLEEAFDRINSTTLNVVSVSEETAASSEEVAAAAEEMTANMAEVADMALKLSEQVERSKEQLNLFVKDIEKIQHLAK